MTTSVSSTVVLLSCLGDAGNSHVTRLLNGGAERVIVSSETELLARLQDLSGRPVCVITAASDERGAPLANAIRAVRRQLPDAPLLGYIASTTVESAAREAFVLRSAGAEDVLVAQATKLYSEALEKMLAVAVTRSPANLVRQEIKSRVDPLLHDLVDFVVNHAEHASSVELLKSHFPISRAVRAFFWRHPSLTLASLVMLARQSLGAALLIYTDRPIKEIEYRLGYEKHSAFSHRFKEAMGVSPRQFRRSGTWELVQATLEARLRAPHAVYQLPTRAESFGGAMSLA